LGRFGDATSRIEEALHINPQSRDAHYELGRLKLQSGEYAGAAAEGEQALPMKSAGTTDRQVFFLLTQAYTKVGDLTKAAEYRRRFEAAAPSLRR
jgi:tetratricopeptide (TPR) repeat protein